MTLRVRLSQQRRKRVAPEGTATVEQVQSFKVKRRRAPDGVSSAGIAC